MTSPEVAVGASLRWSARKANEPAGIQAAIETFQRTGTLWIEDLFDPVFIREIGDHVREQYEVLGPTGLQKKHALVGDKRIMATIRIKGALNSVALYANPVLMSIFQRLLGDQAVIGSFGVVIAFPQAEAQPIHCDYPPLFEDELLCTSLPSYAITLVVPLVDIDETRGATAVWPGSHTWVTARNELKRLAQTQSFAGSVCLYPKVGDAFLMDFRLIHAGTANRSDQPRSILYIVYSRPWFWEDLNFQEQSPINISRKQLKNVPKAWRYLFAHAKAD
jgi:ectoine hydroxylase-related dioxygenase (phytanoyl-CoA dioxygenase family)